jgi:hypothetical protein
MAPRIECKLTGILAADVVGYSRLVGTDEAGTIARLGSIDPPGLMVAGARIRPPHVPVPPAAMQHLVAKFKPTDASG